MATEPDMSGVKKAIEDGLGKAAEPIVRRALQDIEAVIRNRVTEMAISMVEGDIGIANGERRLTIEIIVRDNQ